MLRNNFRKIMPKVLIVQIYHFALRNKFNNNKKYNNVLYINKNN